MPKQSHQLGNSAHVPQKFGLIVPRAPMPKQSDLFGNLVTSTRDDFIAKSIQWLPFENRKSPFYVVNEVTLTGQKTSLKFC